MIETGNALNVKKIRGDFPILQREVNGKPLIYFDNGASAQKPRAVIDSIAKYYSHEHANIHRGVHTLSQEATVAYEDARAKMATYLNANHNEEVIFTSGTTDAINLVAQTFGRKYFREGDEILITAMEHHSNIVPWQMICEETGAVLKVAPIHEDGALIMEAYEDLLSEKTKLVSVVHVSNTLGTVNPIKKIIDSAHAKSIPVLVDGAQAVPHQKIDVQELNCDFYTFSMHKLFGPTGVGILYGRKELLEDLPPYKGGGDMIKTVSFEKTTYNELPHKMEAGTPNIAGGIATGATVDYLNQFNWEDIAAHEQTLLHYATDELNKIEGVKIIGQAQDKASVISFVVEGIHHYDLGVILDKLGIAVRTGHHCTQPLMNFYHIEGTVRISFAFYNTIEEIDTCIVALKKAIQMLK